MVTGAVDAQVPALRASLTDSYRPPANPSVNEEIHRLDGAVLTLDTRLRAAEDRLPEITHAAVRDIEQRLAPQIHDILGYLSRRETQMDTIKIPLIRINSQRSFSNCP